MTIFRKFALCAKALCCAANGPGIFDADSGISETQKQGGVEARQKSSLNLHYAWGVIAPPDFTSIVVTFQPRVLRLECLIYYFYEGDDPFAPAPASNLCVVPSAYIRKTVGPDLRLINERKITMRWEIRTLQSDTKIGFTVVEGDAAHGRYALWLHYPASSERSGYAYIVAKNLPESVRDTCLEGLMSGSRQTFPRLTPK